MNILVTGGAGFIGSNFVRWMKKHAPEHRIVNVDALTYAGNLESLRDIPQDEGYRFLRADIRDRAKMNEIFITYDITHVVNFAAESHVDRSIVDPELFLSTNVLGTQALLDTAKQHWKLVPEDKYSREFRDGVRFLQVSTDEVYGALGREGSFTETTPLAPNSPANGCCSPSTAFRSAWPTPAIRIRSSAAPAPMRSCARWACARTRRC